MGVLRMAHGEEHEIKDEQDGSEHEGEADEAQVVQWIENLDGDILEDVLWLEQDIPAIPAPKTPQVNTQAAKSQGGRNEEPTYEPAQVVLDEDVHAAQGGNGEETTGEGIDGDEHDIVPERNRRAVGEVVKIGDNVRGIGEKGQPGSPKGQQNQPGFGKKTVKEGGDEAETIGHPGKEEIPDKVAVVERFSVNEPAE